MKFISKRSLSWQTGFTLVELLVVIAIIGILSSIILASLNSARDKGANAAVKSNLQGLRSQSEIIYDNNGQNYIGVCTDPNIIAAMTTAMIAGADLTGTMANRCNENATEWAANVLLKAPENGGLDVYWCTDSTGARKGETNELAGATVCS